MAVIKRKDIFPFGTHFYREPALPLEELKRDMRTMKKLGFNTLKIQESWAIDNPREGEINLSTMEELIAEANQLNLYIYFGITMEQMPAWVWKKYPDCRLVNAFGEPHNDSTQYLIPADGKPGPCWDHPGARETTEKFMAKLARSLGRFDNIIVWNCWQEVGFWTILALSCGTTGITFWNHRPEIFWTEGHGFGLCDSKGKPTDRAKEAGKIGHNSRY